jgi:hypothetical protein
MTTKKTVSHSHVSQSHESNVSSKEVPMTTKKTASHSHVSPSEAQPQAQAPAVSTPGEVAPHMATPAASTAAMPTASVALAAPPSNALIPPVPSDYVPQSGTTYRSVAPKKAELLVLAQAVQNLAQFASYAQVMGPYAPPYAETLALFMVVYQWSAMRTSASAWDAYSVDQEGLGWATLRPVMERLRPLFDIAVQADPTLLVKLPSLGTLLGARTAIAQKAVATRQRNKQSKAKGEPQTHGKIGKTRKRAEEKAALETLQGQQQSSVPVATATSPVVTATSAIPAVTNGVNGIANGAGH